MSVKKKKKAAAYQQNNGGGGGEAERFWSLVFIETGGVLICHQRCHYHASDIAEDTIITNNTYSNINRRLSDRN